MSKFMLFQGERGPLLVNVEQVTTIEPAGSGKGSLLRVREGDDLSLLLLSDDFDQVVLRLAGLTRSPIQPPTPT